MKKLLPVIIAIFGLGGGLVAGTFLKPAPDLTEMHATGEDGQAMEKHASDHGNDSYGKDNHGKNGHGKSSDKSDYIYVGLPKPFFAPVLHANNRQALVRLDIHLEVPSDLEDKVAKHDPKLRDAFLRTVMSFANEGGFGRVHKSEGFAILSDDLLLSARSIIGDEVKAVLIGEILTRES